MDILASDAQQVCLDRARRGQFGRSSLKELPTALRIEYFSSRKSGHHFRVQPEKLPPIQWRLHDLLHQSPPPCPFHMIFLRNNLLTYHQGADLRLAFSWLESVLLPGGYLLVGAHENPGPYGPIYARWALPLGIS